MGDRIIQFVFGGGESEGEGLNVTRGEDGARLRLARPREVDHVLLHPPKEHRVRRVVEHARNTVRALEGLAVQKLEEESEVVRVTLMRRGGEED